MDPPPSKLSRQAKQNNVGEYAKIELDDEKLIAISKEQDQIIRSLATGMERE